jgi:hypothetical protein
MVPMMGAFTDYRLLSADSDEELEAAVNGFIEDGYEPMGGVQVVYRSWTNERKGYDESSTWFYQAVAKRAPDRPWLGGPR